MVGVSISLRSKPSAVLFVDYSYSFNVIQDFVEKKYLPKSAEEEMATVMTNNYSKTLAPFPHNIQKGTFY